MDMISPSRIPPPQELSRCSQASSPSFNTNMNVPKDHDCAERARLVSSEIAELQQHFPKLSIQSSTSDFLTGTYERTPYAKVRATITFPESYPHRTLIVDVSCDSVVPPGLKKRLERELGQAAADAAACDVEGSGVGQLHAVFSKLASFVDGNKFLPCWKELRQCVELINSDNNSINNSNNSKKQKPSSITLQETNGKITLRLRHHAYQYGCTIYVNDAYPTTSTPATYGQPLRLRMDPSYTNFPPKMETMLTSQAQELVRRMQDGMTAEDALQFSNPIKAPKHLQLDSQKNKPSTQIRLTQQVVRGLKQDTDTLSHVRDLRQVDSQTKQGNAKLKAHTSKDRREARRQIGKITKSEIAKDEQQEQQWQLEDRKRLESYNISEYDGTNPQKSLLSLVTFLREKIQRLPDEECPICHEKSLPEEPQELLAFYTKSPSTATTTTTAKKKKAVAKLKRPMRTYCGCWYHYHCLDTFMREPPFGDHCPTERCAGRRVYHPEWPAERKELERAWANKQARLREIEDAALFL